MLFFEYKVITEAVVENKYIFLLLLSLVAVILLACLLFLVRSYLRLMERNRALQETIDNLGQLNDRLRMDRHDYLNHLQIVYGLMELEEYEEMNSYLKKVYKELLRTGKAIKTSKPAINALLAAKLSECEAKNIELLIEVKSDLKDIRVEDWELCKVLSNLADNAIKALEEADIPEKKLGINITETKEEYVFDVEDNGPKIPDEIREHIFKKGFSTKKEEGHGMGLAIVSKILEDNGGEIALITNDEKTVFTVKFRKGE
jgi:sensor histidine kinase regulating citrate/malate metabolism